MERIEINVETGERTVIPLTKKDIENIKKEYLKTLSALTWDEIRAKRDQLIRESDWTMLPGCTVNQHDWAVYRQILRDIPQTYKDLDPSYIKWPEPPSTSGPNVKAAEISAQMAEEAAVKMDEEETES